MKDLFEYACGGGALRRAGAGGDENISPSTIFAANARRTSFRAPTSIPRLALGSSNAASWGTARSVTGGDHSGREGSFLKFCQLLGGRMVTEFNPPFCRRETCLYFVGVRVSQGLMRKEIITQLCDGGYSVVDLRR